ncbi:NAD(+) diphosphatase [Paenibacillus sp. 19GGS1-52]|uniref:NAD(+) diphosphatase n=1 Tax=Paenibacillus sp. 19GGS1-52 TaxID=2758563 RepID=UPI001EFAA3E6|nr:NAD(+) diphosphatase [Paenibacillus sp. 19GGS1-52]ULO06745.1 NAD(+) diphosphatase [Paenibacillus sp. 19GGS1-52]
MSNRKESIYKRYIPAIIANPDFVDPTYWFIFSSGKLLVQDVSGRLVIPLVQGIESLPLAPIRTLYLGTLEGIPCYAVEVSAESPEPEGLTFRPLRSLYELMDEDLFHLAGKAVQTIAWDETHQYCGRCGTLTDLSQSERSRVCPQCGLISYPRLAPAVITAIMKDKQILLAHSEHFQNNMYGLIAGFVEPGETLEDCVEREIMEEVGLKVKNITYFDSQQWPFPHSLMIGFLAEYESGEITVDGEEIVHADWFDLDNLPVIPPNVSIARKMIDWLVERDT